LDVGGQDLADLGFPEERVEVLVQVGLVCGEAGGLDVPRGEPDGVEVVAEGDLAAAVVVPGAVADLDLLAVRGALGGSTRAERAGGALPAVGVAVAADEPIVAVSA